MKISILADNRALGHKRFRTEHGLAVLLQTADRQILLDTGASDAFLLNAEQMGIDLSAVDYVFLSHGHADHTGGLSALYADGFLFTGCTHNCLESICSISTVGSSLRFDSLSVNHGLYQGNERESG